MKELLKTLAIALAVACALAAGVYLLSAIPFALVAWGLARWVGLDLEPVAESLERAAGWLRPAPPDGPLVSGAALGEALARLRAAETPRRCTECGEPVHGKGLASVECYADELHNPPVAPYPFS